MSGDRLGEARDHLSALADCLATLEHELPRLDAWGERLGAVLAGGGRLLAAGNGGSAAQAQHLTGELVGRFRDDRAPLSAIALHAETSSLTAIGNDYGLEQAYARQVRAHGRPGDVLIALSTSGESPNVLAAVEAANEMELATWAIAGPSTCALAALCDEAVCVEAPSPATAQECHLVAIHLLCAGVDAHLAAIGAPPAAAAGETRLSTRAGAPLVVVGDALLDRDLEGKVERLSPEAPVPVVDDPFERARAGGAALAAALAAADGERPVRLIAALADDERAGELRRLVRAAGVELIELRLEGETPEKTRVRGGGQTLVRIDRGGRGPSRVDTTAPGSAAARAAIFDAAAVLVSDYGRGVAAVPELREALASLPAHTPVVWDPHPRGAEPVAGCLLVTPNASEARAFVAGADGSAVAGQGLDVARHGAELARRWDATYVSVTRGSEGALLTGAEGPPLVVRPPDALATGDPCGAGDRFASRAAMLLAAGELPSTAVAQAVASASAFVAGVGAAGEGSSTRVARTRVGAGALGAEATLALAERVRGGGGRVIATGGCFDLLHAGHISVLRAARALGDCLVVLLNSDDSVRRLKGPDRPLVGQADRASVLSALDAVDAVMVFDEDTPAQALERLRPDVFAKGGDYAGRDLPEAEVLERDGGQVVVLRYVAGRSTTRLIEEVALRGGR